MKRTRKQNRLSHDPETIRALTTDVLSAARGGESTYTSSAATTITSLVEPRR